MATPLRQALLASVLGGLLAGALISDAAAGPFGGICGKRDGCGIPENDFRRDRIGDDTSQAAPPVPDDGLTPEQRQAREINRSGVQAYEAGYLGQAADNFRQALSRDPYSEIFYENLAEVGASLVSEALQTGSFDAFDDIVGWRGESDYFRTVLANRLYRIGDARRQSDPLPAADLLEKIVEIHPPFSAGHDFYIEQAAQVRAYANDVSAPPAVQMEATSSSPEVLSYAPAAAQGGPLTVDEIENSPGAGAARKAFEAVIAGDWQLALAWYQTALQYDPSNAALQRSVDLAQWTWERKGRLAVPDNEAEDQRAMRAFMQQEMLQLYNDTLAMLTPAELNALQSGQAADAGKPVSDMELDWLLETLRHSYAHDSAGQALAHIQVGDLKSALGLLEIAERQEPETPNYRATADLVRRWMAEKERTQ